MPSGFQNNQDQLTPNFYRVVLTLSSGYSDTSANNDSGRVEPWDFTNFSTLNSTIATSRRRARGNIRFNAILNQLQLFDNVQILDMTVRTDSPARDENAADDTADTVTFTVGYTQEAYVLGGWQKIIGNGAFSDSGATTLTSTPYDQLSSTNAKTAMQNCIREAITRGITIGGSSGYTRRYKTYDPDGANHREEEITVTQPKTPANVWSNVSVTRIEEMTQITND